MITLKFIISYFKLCNIFKNVLIKKYYSLIGIVCLIASFLLFYKYTYKQYVVDSNYLILNEKKLTRIESSSSSSLLSSLSSNTYFKNESAAAASYSSNTKCNIFNKDYKQYTIIMDGISYPQYLFNSQNRSINYDCLNNSSPMKTILAWNKWYGDKSFGYGIGKVSPFLRNNCPITNCELTNDRSRVNESDFVMVLMTDAIEQELPKQYRPSSQRWIFVLIESPAYTGSYTEYNGFFNLTADYLYESDFGSNYESRKRFLWQENKTFNADYDYSNGKTGFLAALISHCSALTHRLAYIDQLKKYINVDVYGNCGVPCPSSIDCRQFIAFKYKFFFAFENSICRDYITEKFFLMLKYDIIPVVIGGGNYSRYVPKSGFIDALQFESPKHLADYLLYLDRNKTAFNSYFKWKKHVTFLDKHVEYGFICEMCIQLHLETFIGIKRKVINDFSSYWNKDQCKFPKVFIDGQSFSYKIE